MGFIREFHESGVRGVEWLAPAKVNIFLQILGKRADGYHELQSLMVPLSFGDLLTVRVAQGTDLTQKTKPISLKVARDVLPTNEDNLVYRAAKLFLEDYPQPVPSVSIMLEKKIPIAAGLGGGSSDAAALLLSLNYLFDFPKKPMQLHEIGKKLGADVPFFLLEKAALARGIGEELIALEKNQPYSFVLVNPGFAVSTAWVYQNLDLSLTSTFSGETMAAVLQHSPSKNWSLLLRNDLESVTLKAHPVLKEIQNHLVSLGADGSLMSGSGPTVFGIFSGKDRERRAQSAWESLQERSEWKVILAESV